ncbi:rhomboid family intramembrane serine protease [Aestuariibacter halophilus]|uniref:Rhomboid family intramembrane serine protease n=1 Tax=Fluctibacter halophilus TaxID=226011 RepID=A0ABS8G310_9ALTE|nr:rhomboid family intramembrane serine protease [Aestuariibacter halophilus]MCC2614920.1 rhomboid family intramembrane serine protease [Aestuariibacter halophilus]
MTAAPFRYQLRVISTWLLVLVVVEFINLVSGRSLTAFGLVPRHTDHLAGIVLAPFLHGSPWHLAANLLPLAIMQLLLFQYGRRLFWQASAMIIVLSGLTVWLLGRDAIHVGASGLVYGYFGFLLVGGVRSGQLRQMAIAVLVAVVYGGLLYGVVPRGGQISWEYHLFGLLAGAIVAIILVGKRR